jgi:hypothetical protein
MFMRPDPGLAGPPCGDLTGRLSGFRRRSGCVPAEPYPPLKQREFRSQPDRPQQEAGRYPKNSNFDRTDLSSFDRTTTTNNNFSAVGRLLGVSRDCIRYRLSGKKGEPPGVE